MKVIIDTNIFLNFFRRQGEQSLVLLNSLISFLENNKFEICLPKQIEDEYWRRKQEVVEEHIKELEVSLKTNIPLPLFLESFKKSKDLKKIAKRFNLLKKEVIIEYKKRVANPNSQINKKINKLFSFSTKLEEDTVILDKAYFRTLKGNPPKKGEKSFGDAIVWETILKNCIDDNLVIISGDGDYTEKYNDLKLHGYLEKEWTSMSNKNIKLYTNLGLFINEQSGKKKPIKKATIQEENYLNTNLLASKSYQLLSSLGKTDSVFLNSVSPGNVVFNSLNNQNNVAGVFNLKNRCMCCHEEYEDPSGIYSVFGKCSNCNDPLSMPSMAKTCDKCGKHYHESFNSSYVAFSSNKCKDCR